VLDLTRESLYECKEITENDLQQLSQDFANHVKWECEPATRITLTVIVKNSTIVMKINISTQMYNFCMYQLCGCVLDYLVLIF